MCEETKTALMLSPEEMQPAAVLLERMVAELGGMLLGQSELHKLVLTGVLSRGHILLEGVPGVGKTALVKALGQLMNLEFKRIQMTPDLMPGDIVGSHILEDAAGGRREMRFQPGPVFTNILLADEINRASPKTQSALLEAMQERCVTLLGTTRPLPNPFFVLASQNPIEMEGTYPLPEAQLDRFLFKLIVPNPEAEVLDAIISTRRRGEPPPPTWSISREELLSTFALMDRILMPKAVSRYISRLVEVTHPTSANTIDIVKDYVSYGASPRAAIAMAESSRAYALLANRPTVGFEDIKAVTPHVLNHRLILNYRARFDGVSVFDVITRILEQVKAVDLGLPDDVEAEGV